MDEKTGFQSQMKLLDSPNPVYEKSCCKNKKSEDSSTENLMVIALTDEPASENFAWDLSIVENRWRNLLSSISFSQSTG